MKELAAVEKCPYSLDELNSMIRDVDERSEDIREAIEQYHHQLEDLQDQLDIRDEKNSSFPSADRNRKKNSIYMKPCV